MLFGAEISDPITAVPAWVGAAGSISTVIWLLFMGLPSAAKQFNKLVDDKDRNVAKLLDDKDILIDKIQTKHESVIKTIMEAQAVLAREGRQDNKEALRMVIDHCQRENASGNAMFLKALDEVRLAVADLRETVEELRAHPS